MKNHSALYSTGIPEDDILVYETAIKSGKFVPRFHGTAGAIERARNILAAAKGREGDITFGRASKRLTFIHHHWRRPQQGRPAPSNLA